MPRPAPGPSRCMKSRIFALLALFVCLVETEAQDTASQPQIRGLTYEQVLERWDRARAFGYKGTLREWSQAANEATETNAFSAGLRDGPVIRFYTRVCQSSSGVIVVVIVIGVLFWFRGDWLPRLQLAIATIGNERKIHPVPALSRPADDSKLYGVGGWLLVLCIWITIVGPLLSFAKLAETVSASSQWLWGIIWIFFSVATGILLWIKHRIAWQVAVAFFWSISGFAWLGVFVENSPESITQAFAMSILSGIWLPYLNKSKRVFNTYRNMRLTRPIPPPLKNDSTASPDSLDGQLRALAKLREDGIIN